ncbi:HepT-like ribonuclease domain-containing protein [Picosynechococcus sp. PCC 8807]|uniref:HepT-like ribonuclease domain-containing protein n=1 Tax=Picosynechococcus sp. PCC 8807 TaxID=195248 RepID=UPI0008109EB7|nr:HepT-like ribonuclease domain-containing protein [Picosynechococcus sp. PCC 8807]ANV92058.1 nucleotidyltransferase [Picosynechococcus sp. PCC 8807]
MRDDLERLRDMEEALLNIERYALRGKAAFFEEELIQTWVLFHVQILGEAARSMSADLMAKYSDVPWQKIIGFRNLVVHEYFRVDLQIVWRIVERELPLLKAQIQKILRDSQL